MDVIIIGSGFAGLVAAITLSQHNNSLKVLEAFEKPVEVGGSITLFPNGIKVLRRLGMAGDVINAGTTITHTRFLDASGNFLIDRSMGTTELFGEPTVVIRRALLHGILRAKADSMNISVEYGKRVSSIKQNLVEATVCFADSTELSAKVVVGCDGNNSITRAHVLDREVNPVYSNLLYLAGFVDDQNFIDSLGLDFDKQYVSIGPNHYFGYAYIDNQSKEDTSIFWSCMIPQSNRLTEKQLQQIDRKYVQKKVLNIHEGWHEPVEDLVRNTTSVCKGSISDIVEIEKWFKDRVILIGDAAHSMNPISGQGACTAMEDGYILAKLLQRYDLEYSVAFNLFEKIRRKRVTKIGKKARRSSKQSTIKFSGYIEKVRNYSFALLTLLTPERILNWSYYYDAHEESMKAKQ